ncbi:MAG: hypothetical protein LBV08_10785 [Clostridiales bacterium]|jgi:hypothetical protein|nr:hypothetical protein [Clostridiales bacterium]
MTYSVQVKGFNKNIEEEILVQIDNVRLSCFVTNWGIDIEVNKFYDADIGVTILDDLKIYQQTDHIVGFEQINDTFAYFIYGKFDFDSRTIDAGAVIEFDQDEVDLSDYSYLDGKYISAKVDRITLAFV